MKTKFYLLAILSLAISPYSVFSQSKGFRTGVHFSIGEARITDANISNQTGSLLLQGGVAASYQFNDNFGIISNILFTKKGSRATGTERVSTLFGTQNFTFEEEFSLYYIEFPVMAKASLGINSFHLKAFGGPSLNFNISGTQDRVYADPDYNEDNGFRNQEIQGLNLLEYALVLGAGFDVEISDESVFYLEFRENWGLNSFGRINNQDAYNKYFSIGIGFLYKY